MDGDTTNEHSNSTATTSTSQDDNDLSNINIDTSDEDNFKRWCDIIGGENRRQRQDNNMGNNKNRRGRSGRDISRQQRAGGLEEIEALESFRKQHEQFDRGKEKFKERLNSSNRELIDYVHNENRKRTRRKTKGLRAAALEIARRERSGGGNSQGDV